MGNIEAVWTGKYPCLCSGEWIIKYNGIQLEIPKEYRYNNMGTYGDYDKLVDVLNEEFEEYSDGLEYSEWISQNGDWIINMFNKVGVFPNTKLLTELYEKIQQNDWRSGSCGGCI